MNDRVAAGLAAVVTLLVGVGRTVPGIVRARLVGGPGPVPELLPVLGTPGETIAVYLSVLQVVGPLVTWALVLGVGYYLASRRGADGDLRRLAVDLATGSLTAVAVVAFGVVGVQVLTGSLSGVLVLAWATSLVATLLSTSVPVVAGGVAAAAVTDPGPERARDGPAAANDADAAEPRAERVREHAVEDAD